MRTVTRRAFLVSGAMLAVPFATHAQPAGKVYRLGYLTPTAPETFGATVFRQALRDLGWVEGRNLLIDYRSADGKFERLPGLAAQLIRLKLDLIVAIATVSALAAQKATSDIPIVFAYVSDAVGSGLVEGLARLVES